MGINVGHAAVGGWLYTDKEITQFLMEDKVGSKAIRESNLDPMEEYSENPALHLQRWMRNNHSWAMRYVQCLPAAYTDGSDGVAIAHTIERTDDVNFHFPTTTPLITKITTILEDFGFPEPEKHGSKTLMSGRDDIQMVAE